MTAEVLEKTITQLFTPSKMTVTNFKCFEKFEFDFGASNGLYLITGRNLQEPALGSNGLGKSSTLDALCFCLYGKTYRNAKAGKLLNRNVKAKGYGVTLTLKNGDQEKILKRTWGPISCSLDGVEVTQSQIDALIGLTFDQFCLSVYWGQNGSSFIDLSAADKLNFLSQLFELDKWIKCTELAKIKHSASNSKLDKLTQQKTFSEQSIDTLLADIIALKDKAKTYEQQKLSEISDINDAITNLLKDIKPVPDATEVNNEIVQIDETYKQLVSMKTAFEEKQNSVKAFKMSIDRDVNKHRLELEKVVNKAGTQCPSCQQTITEEHTHSIAESLMTQIESLEKQLNDVDAGDTEETAASLKEIAEMLDTLTANKNDCRVKLESIKSVESANASVKNQINRLRDQIGKLEKASNPFDTAIQEDRLATTQQLIIDINKHLEVVTKQKDQYEFWQKRFPMIRLSILQEVIDELAMHFNQAFSSLGLDWEVKLTTERELKNESIKNEIHMTLLRDGQELDLPSLSGGELQRVKFACGLGISDLIKSHLNVPCNLMLLDEPLASLSLEGQEFVLAVLRELADHQAVYLAEHRVLELAKFDRVYSIIKNTDGNSILETF